MGCDLAVDLGHAEGAAAVLFGFLADGAVRGWGGSNVSDIVAHAHDNDARLAAAIDHEALIPLGGTPQNLPELGAGGKGGNHVLHPLIFRVLNSGYLHVNG